jgi:FlgD Ig-like domain
MSRFNSVMASLFVAAALAATVAPRTSAASSTTGGTVRHALADSFEVVFGPQTFTRGRGAPQTFTEEFEHCGAGPCRIVVTNGNDDGTGRLSSAFISLNGTQVVGPNAFNQQVDRIVEPVTLQHDNELTVRLASMPEGVLTITIECSMESALRIASHGADALDPATLVAAVGIANDGQGPAANVVLTSVELPGGTLNNPALPYNLGTIAVDDAAILNLHFNGGPFLPGQTYPLTLRGTYMMGTATTCFVLATDLTVPPASPGSAILTEVPVPPLMVVGGGHPPEPPAPGDLENSEVNPPGWMPPKGPFIAGPPTPGETGFGEIPPLFGPKSETGAPEGAPAITFTGNHPVGINANTCCAEPSGARGGGVVFMTANSYAAYSTDGGTTFTRLNPTTIFPNGADGGFCCDQIVQYVPSIDRFVWLMQFWKGADGKNRQRLASASPAAIMSSGGTAWTYWDLTSNVFGINGWLDYPDLAVGNNYLYMSCDQVGSGLLVVRIPLSQIQSSSTINIGYTNPALSNTAYFGHLTQNTRDEVFWAGQVNTGKMRIFSLAEGSNLYSWRDRTLPRSWSNSGLSSTTPDGKDWLQGARNNGFYAAIGAVHIHPTTDPNRDNHIWFAWHAGTDDFFQRAHVEMVNIDRADDFKVSQQVQIWNNNYAFAYPALSLGGCSGFQIGLSLGFGGGGNYENHVVGFWGDYVVYKTTSSNVGGNRYGDYLTIRQQAPTDPTNPQFDAFGWGIVNDATGTHTDVRFVSFGRPQSACIIPLVAAGHRSGVPVGGTVGDRPQVFALGQNSPNPFNPMTRIMLSLPQASPYTVSIYDVAGRRVRTFEGESAGPGQVAIDWDGTTENGARVSSGIYLYKAQAGDFSDTKRMIMLK